MEKLNKAIDLLKLAQVPIEERSKNKKEAGAGVKEKKELCQQIVFQLNSPIVKSHADYAKQFTAAMENLFILCDDADSNLRMVAEESINAIFRRLLTEGNATRVHVELYRELKRNGAARSIKAALHRFADLAHLIRPTKSRMFAMSLVPCITSLSKRPEEAVQEELGKAADKIFPVLGPFFSDDETKKMIKALVENLSLQSVVSRRSAATLLIGMTRHGRKKTLFTVYLFRKLRDMIVPVQVDAAVPQIQGALLALRQLMPLVRDCVNMPAWQRESEHRMTVKGTILRMNQPQTITLDNLLQIYEVTLYYTCSTQPTLITGALELLVAILSHAPRSLRSALLNPEGLVQSRIFAHHFSSSANAVLMRPPGGGPTIGLREGHSRKSSFSGGGLRSGMSSVGGSETDLTSIGKIPPGALEDPKPLFDDEQDEQEENGAGRIVGSIEPDPSSIASTATSVGSESTLSSARLLQQDETSTPAAAQTVEESVVATAADKEEDGNLGSTTTTANRYSAFEMGEIIDDPLGAAATNQAIDDSSSPQQNDNISSIKEKTDEEGEKENEDALVGQDFLLSPSDGGNSPSILSPSSATVPQQIGTFTDTEMSLLYCARLLSVKFLLSGTNGQTIPDREVRVSHKSLALTSIGHLIKLWPMLLDHYLYRLGDSQPLSDLLLFSTHSDPQLRGATAHIASAYIHSIAYQYREKCNETIVERLENILLEILTDENSMAIRNCVEELSGAIDGLLSLSKSTAPPNRHGETVLKLMNALLNNTQKPYWLLKVSLSDLFCSLDYGELERVERSSSSKRMSGQNQEPRSPPRLELIDRVLDHFCSHILPDEDGRVRTAAARRGLIGLIYSISKASTSSTTKNSSLAAPTTSHSIISSNFQLLPDFPPVQGLPFPYSCSSISSELQWNESNDSAGGSSDVLSSSSRGHQDMSQSASNASSPQSSLQSSTVDEMVLCRIVTMLCDRLTQSPSIYGRAGYVEGLLSVARRFPPTRYRSAWSLEGTRTGFLMLLFQLLSTSNSASLKTYSHLLELESLLFAGQGLFEISIPRQVKSDKWPLLFAPSSDALATDIFMHCLRLLNVYWSILTESPQSVGGGISGGVGGIGGGSGGPSSILPRSAPSLPAAPSLSPVKRGFKSVTGGVAAGVTGGGKGDLPGSTGSAATGQLSSGKQKAAADALNLPHFVRLHGMLRGSYSNYLTSLDSEVFTQVLKSVLRCLGQLLELASFNDVNSYAEELLMYFKVTMNALPGETVVVVTQLLKALFGTNLNLTSSLGAAGGGGGASSKSGVSSNATGFPFNSHSHQHAAGSSFGAALAAATNRHELAHSRIKQHLGWLSARGDKHVLGLLKNTQSKAALTNYIRFFEPVVVQVRVVCRLIHLCLQSLKLYTSSVGLSLQRAVLGLLSQLVSVRVNYCLLDTDQKFLSFLYQQLESVDQENFRNADELVPSLMTFLVVLSYEKQNNSRDNKPIVEIPKVLQLCDALLASGQNPQKIVLPVIHTLVCDLYFVRPSNSIKPDAVNLEIQQEVLAALLMKYLEQPMTFDVLCLMLAGLRRENEGKWKKLSRDIVDRLFPTILTRNQVDWGSTPAEIGTGLRLIELLCPSSFRPTDTLLNTLMSSWPTVTDENDVRLIIRWTGSRMMCLWALLLHCKEDAILTRLESIKDLRASFPRSQNWLTTNDAENDAETMFSQFLLSTIQLLADRLATDSNSKINHAVGEQPNPSSATSSIVENNERPLLEKMLEWIMQLTLHIVKTGVFPTTQRHIRSMLMGSSILSSTSDDNSEGRQQQDAFLRFATLCPLHVTWSRILSAVLRQAVMAIPAPEENAHSQQQPVAGGVLDSMPCLWTKMLTSGNRLYKDSALISMAELFTHSLSSIAAAKSPVAVENGQRLIESLEMNRYTMDFIRLSHVPVVRDLIRYDMLMWADPELSTELALNAIALISASSSVSFVRKCVNVLSGVYLDASGHLLSAVVSLLSSSCCSAGASSARGNPTILAVTGRLLDRLGTRRLEILLVNRSPNALAAVPAEMVEKLLDKFLIGGYKMKERFALLYSLLIKLFNSWYPEAAGIWSAKRRAEETVNPVIPNGPPNKFNSLKFIQLIQNGLNGHAGSGWGGDGGGGGLFSGWAVAEAVQHCTAVDEVTEILSSSPTIPIRVMYAACRLGVELMTDPLYDDGHSGRVNSAAGMNIGMKAAEILPPNVLCGARIAALRRIGMELRDESVPVHWEWINVIGLILDGGEVEALTDSDLMIIVKYFLALFKLNSPSYFSVVSAVHTMEGCLCLLSNKRFTDWLDRTTLTNPISFELQMIRFVYSLITDPSGPIQSRKLAEIYATKCQRELPFNVPANQQEENGFDPEPHLTGWRQIGSMLEWVNDYGNNNSGSSSSNDISGSGMSDLRQPRRLPTATNGDCGGWPKSVIGVIKDLVLSLARVRAVCSLCRVPPAAFQYGWRPDAVWRTTADGAWGGRGDTLLTLPTTPVHHLQNVDVLREFLWRVCATGWRDRQQFEEIWMALLGVLSATPVGQELQSDSSQEITERVMSSSLAVGCISGLLIQSLLSPVPGNPIASSYILKHREKPSSFLKSSNGKKVAYLKWGVSRVQRRTGCTLGGGNHRRNGRRSAGGGGGSGGGGLSMYSNGRMDSDPAILGGNPERCYNASSYGFGQLSMETLWSITGILAEEKLLLMQPPPPTGPPTLNQPGQFGVAAGNLASSMTERVLGILGGSGAADKAGGGGGSGEEAIIDPFASPTKELPISSLGLTVEDKEMKEGTNKQQFSAATAASNGKRPLHVREPSGHLYYDDEDETELTSWRNSTRLDLAAGASDPGKRPHVKQLRTRYVLKSNSNLDLVSCLTFLLDLYGHWLRDGSESVPLSLLSATVQSLVLLSDLFTERGQYEWLKRQLRPIWASGSKDQEDELLMPHLILGLLKTAAVLGTEDSDGQKEIQSLMESGLSNPQLSVRIHTLHGLMYLLQSLSSDESWGLIPPLVDFIRMELSGTLACADYTAVLSRPQGLDYQLILWATGFYITESFQDPYSRQNFVPEFLEQCRKAWLCPTINSVVLSGILCGIESLLSTSSLDGSQKVALSKQATALLQKQPSLSCTHSLLALQLLTVSLYTGLEEGAAAGGGGGLGPDGKGPLGGGAAGGPNNGAGGAGGMMAEPRVSAMEQLTYLFTKVSVGWKQESSAVGEVLPWFLIDNFSPGDVINRVISQIHAPSQSHSKTLFRAVQKLFGVLWKREAGVIVWDWALAAISHRPPPSPSPTNTLTPFVVTAAPTNSMIALLFPLALDRIGKWDATVDTSLFLLVIGYLKSQLKEESQIRTLKDTLKKADDLFPDSAFGQALESINAE